MERTWFILTSAVDGATKRHERHRRTSEDGSEVIDRGVFRFDGVAPPLLQLGTQHVPQHRDPRDAAEADRRADFSCQVDSSILAPPPIATMVKDPTPFLALDRSVKERRQSHAASRSDIPLLLVDEDAPNTEFGVLDDPTVPSKPRAIENHLKRLLKSEQPPAWFVDVSPSEFGVVDVTPFYDIVP